MNRFIRLSCSATLIACAALLAACGENVAVVALPGSGAAGGANNSAVLTWLAPSQNTDGTPLTDISGYYVYVGTDPNSLTATTDLADASATSYTVTNLSPGKWYFAISAYNALGIDGELSNIGSKSIV